MTALLEVCGLTKHYLGLTAVDQVDFEVEEGAVVGLIGPNGSGKSTIVDCLSGFQPADGGRWRLEGRELAGSPAHRIARAGLTRTFQLVKPFGNLSVIDNVMIGALTRLPTIRAARVEADRVIDSCGLGSYATAHARTLPIGLRKRLEVARALATRPRLLLLDEVMAGLNPTELAGMIELIHRLHADNLTVILIEHIMAAMMRLARRIVVLHHGERIAEGPPAAIAQDRRVVDAYLGEDFDLAQA